MMPNMGNLLKRNHREPIAIRPAAEGPNREPLTSGNVKPYRLLVVVSVCELAEICVAELTRPHVWRSDHEGAAPPPQRPPNSRNVFRAVGLAGLSGGAWRWRSPDVGEPALGGEAGGGTCAGKAR